MPKDDALRDRVGQVIGGRIREPRVAAGLSQKGLALRAGLGSGVVNYAGRAAGSHTSDVRALNPHGSDSYGLWTWNIT